MKKFFKKKKKSTADASSLASGRSASGYSISPKKDLQKIHKAAFDNDVAKLKTLLKKSDVNQLDKENRTALHLACSQGNVDAVRVLVSHPLCNLNLCDNDRRSALMKCVQCQFHDCLEILLNKRADVNLSDINGNTALHLSAAIPSVDACCLLLDSNADVHQKNKEGSTPLHIAASTEGSENVIQNLIEDGSQVNVLSGDGKTALMLAASRGYLEIVRLLLNNKADASIKDSRGWSADDYASMSGHHPISMIIFEHSQTQQKQKKVIPELPSSGDHIYATVNRGSTSKEKQLKTNSKSFLHEDDDLSLSEDSSTTLPISDPDLSFKSEEKKPVVNVAAFMKQRLQKKEQVVEESEDDVEDSSPPPSQKQSGFDIKTPMKDEESSSGLRSRGYDSNSRKGGIVSPRKPPLSTSQTHKDEQKKKIESDDDSPWDDEEDEIPPPHLQFQKPNTDIMKNLGLTADDVNDLYDDVSDGSIHVSEPRYNANKEEEEVVDVAKNSEDSDEERTSSAWDDEDDGSAKSLPKAANKYIATSSLVRFDDEISDPEHPKSSTSLQQQGVIFESNSEDEDTYSNKVAKDFTDVTASSSQPKADHRLSVKQSSSSEDDSIDEDSIDDDSVETESEWEKENRQRRIAKDEENKGASDGGVRVPVETKQSAQKTLALEAAAAVRLKADRRREEEKRDEEEHLELLGSQDRLKIEEALQDALAGSGEPTESDVSEIDDHLMGNAPLHAKKMADKHIRNGPSSAKGLKINLRSSKGIGKEIDPNTWTATETDSDMEEDLVGVIPASLRSSELSNALVRSGERGELEREAAEEKRRAMNAIEQLEFARRDVMGLKEEVRGYKIVEEEWNEERSKMEADAREMKFEQNNLKEKLSTSELELKTTKDRMKRIEDNLAIESDTRRKHEVTIRELQNELKMVEHQLKKFENEREELLSKRQQSSIEDQISREKMKVEKEIEEETKQSRQFEAVSLLLQEKEQELIQVKAERDSLEEARDRYKSEVTMWHSKGDDKVGLLSKLNEELNEKVEELSCCLKESDEHMQQIIRQHSTDIQVLKQANDAVAQQIKREQLEKDVALRDLEALNDQQRMLKNKIEEVEEKFRKEENKCASLEGEIRGVREQKEDVERRLHVYEKKESSNLLESSNLRTTLTHKESTVAQMQRDNQEMRERIRTCESDLNEARRENAKYLGRIEMLQADVSQQESERIRLRRELEDARNVNNTTLSTQQGKLSDIMTANQTERIELEKQNAQLQQQVVYLREELERRRDDIMKKDEELAGAQQDRIETHKQLSFTESSMERLNESQQQLQHDKQLLITDLDSSKTRCASLENRVEEVHRQVETLRNQLAEERETTSKARHQVLALEADRTNDRDMIAQLDRKVLEMDKEKSKMQSQLSLYESREEEGKDDRDLMMKSRVQLEEIVVKLQEEKVAAEEKMKTESQRIQMLENEASGHRRMWEEEVKARSKLSVELARMDRERSDARKLLDAFKDKYTRASVEEKSYRTKYENERRSRSKMGRKLDEYSSKMAAESRVRYDTSESECDSRLSRMSDEFASEKSRMETAIHQLEARVLSLDKSNQKERDKRRALDRELQMMRTSARDIESSISDLEKERDHAVNELKRVRSQPKSPDHSRSQTIINAQVNSKLDQVNTWLEGQAVAQEVLEKLRFDNEEKRVAEANQRAEELQKELFILRARLSRANKDEDEEKMRKKLQEVIREKIDLQEKLIKSKHEVEEVKLKLDHEKKKYSQLRSSTLTSATAATVGGGAYLNTSQPHLSTSLPNHPSVDALTSTPRGDTDHPILAQLRHKLDASIAMRLSSPPLKPDRTASNRSVPDRPPSNEYFIP